MDSIDSSRGPAVVEHTDKRLLMRVRRISGIAFRMLERRRVVLLLGPVLLREGLGVLVRD